MNGANGGACHFDAIEDTVNSRPEASGGLDAQSFGAIGASDADVTGDAGDSDQNTNRDDMK